MQVQDIHFVSEVYLSVAKGEGIEPVIERYTAAFPDIRFSWQAMCVKTNEYFAWRTYNFDSDAVDDYLPIAHLNEIPAMAARFPMRAVVKSDFFLTSAQYERTDIYDLFFRPRDDLNSSMGLWAHRDGSNVAFLGVDVPRAFDGEERLRLEQSLATILPHLQGAFELMLDLDVRRSRLEQARLWLDTLPAAAFILRAEGEVSRRNQYADRLARDAGVFQIGRDGRLAYASVAQRDAVEAPLRRSLAALEPIGPFAIPAADEHRLSGYCVPLPTGLQQDPVLSFFHGAGREALLVVVDATDLPRAAPEAISATLGITPAEARIVAKLCEGGDLREAASALGIAYSTARTQLSSATEKLGLNRQTELVAAAAHTLARLAGLPRPPER